MKKLLLFLSLIPVLAFGKSHYNGITEDDWYRVIKGWTFPGFWWNYPLHPGDEIYVYAFSGGWATKGWVRIAVFDSRGRYLDYYWQGEKDAHWLTDPEYCVFLENREDKRYK